MSNSLWPFFGVNSPFSNSDTAPLCVGIDPHPALLKAWGLTDSADGVRKFSQTVVEAVELLHSSDAQASVILKPQSAFFERHGSAGIGVLEEVIASAQKANIPTIIDAKRGDIGSTMAGYADAYLKQGSPLAGDAVTISPYLGFDSALDLIEQAASNDKGVFVLCLTSNPEGATVQHSLTADGESVAAHIARRAAEINKQKLTVGLVIGATVGSAIDTTGVRQHLANTPILSPGVGAQGAGNAELQQVFAGALPNVIPSVSRAILNAGPSAEGLAGGMRQYINL